MFKIHNLAKVPIFRCPRMGFECPNQKTETTFSRQHPPKMVEQVFVLFIYHFWTRNRLIMNFEHFELVLPCFYIEKNEYHNGPSILISLAQMVKHLYICDQDMYSNGKIHCAFQIIDFFYFPPIGDPPYNDQSFRRQQMLLRLGLLLP